VPAEPRGVARDRCRQRAADSVRGAAAGYLAGSGRARAIRSATGGGRDRGGSSAAGFQIPVAGVGSRRECPAQSSIGSRPWMSGGRTPASYRCARSRRCRGPVVGGWAEGCQTSSGLHWKTRSDEIHPSRRWPAAIFCAQEWWSPAGGRASLDMRPPGSIEIAGLVADGGSICRWDSAGEPASGASRLCRRPLPCASGETPFVPGRSDAVRRPSGVVAAQGRGRLGSRGNLGLSPLRGRGRARRSRARRGELGRSEKGGGAVRERAG